MPSASLQRANLGDAMFEPDATLRQVLDAVVNKWGTSAALTDLAAVVGWNAKWQAAAEAEKATRAARLVADAAELVRQIEDAEREGDK